MAKAKTYSVGDLARLAGVSIRTLHHYDDIGLLRPASRSASGYRVYTPAEVERLHAILIHRALGCPLESIRALLDSPSTTRTQVLMEQREALNAQKHRAEAMITSIDRMLARDAEGDEMSVPTHLFDGFDAAAFDEEARERWEATSAWQTSQARTGQYKEADWRWIRAEMEAVESAFAWHLQKAFAPDSAQVIELAERHRRLIDRWFYPCSHDMHQQLGAMYTEDERFKAHYERRCTGLAVYVAAAVEANAEQHGVVEAEG